MECFSYLALGQEKIVSLTFCVEGVASSESNMFLTLNYKFTGYSIKIMFMLNSSGTRKIKISKVCCFRFDSAVCCAALRGLLFLSYYSLSSSNQYIKTMPRTGYTDKNLFYSFTLLSFSE